MHIYYKIILFVVLLLVSLSVAAEGIDGQSKDSYFFPKSQAYQIINAKFDGISKIPRDLRGIPTILRGSTIFFTEKYFTLKSINSGATKVVGSCFEKIGNLLIIRPAGRFTKSVGKELLLWEIDDYLEMEYGHNIQLKLKKISLPDDFESKKRRLDLAYNSAIQKGYGRDVSCKLDVIKGIRLSTNNYRIVYEDRRQEKSIKDGVLDPDSPINSGYMSYAKRVSLDEDVTIGNCQGNILMHRYALGRVDQLKYEKKYFYLITALVGKTGTRGQHCTKVKELKKVYMHSISDIYSVHGRYRDLSFRFNRWVGDYSLVVRHKQSERDFLITDINKDTIRISEIPFEENKK